MARWTSTATTEESTPPDSAHSTRSEPTWRRIESTADSMNEGIDQSPRAPQARRKFLRTVLPCGVWATSGWNCTAKNFLSRSAMAATGQLSVDARAVNPFGALRTVSPWLIHTDTRPSRSGSTPSRIWPAPDSVSDAAPYSRRWAGTTCPPSR